MPTDSRARLYPVLGLLLALALLAALPAAATGGGSGDDTEPAAQTLGERAVAGQAPVRTATPADRYAMAGGCYTVRSLATGGQIVRDGDGVALAPAGAPGEPFHFQATDLGSYLLFDSEQRFLAASEGALGQAVREATDTTAGGLVSSVTGERSDAAAAALASSPVADAAGRGAEVVRAGHASGLADWDIDQQGKAFFTITLPATGQALVAAGDGTLQLVPADDADGGRRFTFDLTGGCATFPEIEVNVDGDVLGGHTPYEEVRGYLEGHLHMMAFEFIGGRVRCGRPWHPYGAPEALVDCPDHEPGGRGAILEAFLSGHDPGTPHDTEGWPGFPYWPRHDSLTHEQVYYKWLERAWRGGQRMVVNLLVDNNQLCTIYPYKRNSCNEMDGVRLQTQRIAELERYIDAQSGGPGKGWMRIVHDPHEARRVMNEGKLAIVLGIEVSVLFDCSTTAGVPECSADEIDERLDEVYDAGVRQMELVNKFDNALSGVTGDAGATGVLVNGANFLETGSFWRMGTCEDDGPAHDKLQHNVADDTHGHAHDHGHGDHHDAALGRDSIFGAVAQVAGTSGAAPLYPQGPHCNELGLSDLGAHLLRRMVDKGMLFDPDHMSAKARRQALDLMESLGYSGVISSHSWADDTIYPRIYRLGGVVTPHAGDSSSFVEKWRAHRAWADPRYLFGFGFGSDVNGFSRQGGPRGALVSDPVTYPFTGFGGVTVHAQRSGTRVYDINTDGVAHYGLYPDWVEDLRRQAGDAIVEDLERGPEAYLQMWERAMGIAPDACRPDVAELSATALDRLRRNMTPEQVLAAIGQPNRREGTTFTYCVDGGTGTVEFSAAGRLVRTTRA